MLCVLTTLFSSCKKNELVEEIGLSNRHNGLAYAGDKKYDILGYGYDITGRFANSQSARLQVIDIEKFVREDGSSFSPNDNVEEFFEYTFGENMSSYSHDLNQKYTATLNLTKILFKVELNTSFNSADTFSSKYAFATASKVIRQKSMKLYSTVSNLRTNYLTAKFRFDLADLTPAELVQRYGTHVLTDISLGAKFEVNYKTQTTSSNRKEAVKAGVTLNGLWKTFSLTAEIEAKNEEANSNFDQTLIYRSVGGDGTGSIIGNLALDKSTINLSIANWQSSCKPEFAVLIGIGKDGLIPLQDMIEDPTKKEAVRLYIEHYFEFNQVQIITEPTDNNPGVYNPLKEGLLFQTPDGRVFTVIDGKARHIKDYGTLVAVFNFETTTIKYHADFKPIATVTSHIKQIPNLASEGLLEGQAIMPGAELLHDTKENKTYLYENPTSGRYLLRHILNPDVANRYRFKLPNARKINGTYGYIIGPLIQ